MSSSPRPFRNAEHTRQAARQPASFSDTSARQSRDPTNWLCRREFSQFLFCRKVFWSRTNEVTPAAKANKIAVSPAASIERMLFRFAQRRLRNYSQSAGWSSLVARQAHNLKAAGSNPAPATKFFVNSRCLIASTLSGIPKADFTLDLAKTSTFEFNNIMLECLVLL